MSVIEYIISMLPTLLLSVPIVLFSLSAHELSHGYAAYLLGDPTARNQGRLSLNPLHHLDPLGALCTVLFRFGWAKPVPVDCRYFKNPKRGMALTALAGPLMNLVLSFLFGCLAAAVESLYPLLMFTGSTAVSVLFSWIYTFFYLAHTMNLYLAVFNLIPIPPLDGSRILFVCLPTRYYFKVMRYERYIQLVLLVLIYFGFADGFLTSLVEPISNSILSLFSYVYHWLISLLL